MDISARSQTSLDFRPGDRIAGRFEICERIGSGGMGLVYRVIDRELDDEMVALKLLHPFLAQDESVFRRFRNEVLVARSLSHPNIVRTHDIGRAENGLSYISMEFIDGYSLKDMQMRVDASGNERKVGLEFDHAVKVLFQILTGIGYAHTRGVIHRDLKPANILITSKGEVKIADFGTARIMGMDTSITRTGQVIGTPDYMSPEQIRGELLEPASDIYSVGVMAYELVTAKRPFVAETPVAIAYKHLNEPLPEFEYQHSDVAPWFEAMVRTAAAKRKEDRYQTAGLWTEALLEHLPELARQHYFMPADGTHRLKTYSEEIDSRETVLETPTPIPTASAPPSSHGEWTLHYTPPAATDFTIGEQHEVEVERTVGFGRLLTFLVLGPIAGLVTLAFVCRVHPPAEAYMRESVFQNQVPKTGIFGFFASIVGIKEKPTSVAAPSRDEREQLQRELLAALPAPSPVAYVPPPTQSVTRTEEPRAQIESTPQVVQQATPQPTAQVVVQQPTPQPTAAVPTPEITPTLIPTPLPAAEVTGTVFVRKGTTILDDPSVEAGELSAVRWMAIVKNVPQSPPKEKISLNVFDQKVATVIEKVVPQRVESGETVGEYKVTGSLASFESRRPTAGTYRLDLIFDGEVLASKQLTVYRASVTESTQPTGQDSRVAIVRGPAYVPPPTQPDNQPAQQPPPVAQYTRNPELSPPNPQLPSSAEAPSVGPALPQPPPFYPTESTVNPMGNPVGNSMNEGLPPAAGQVMPTTAPLQTPMEVVTTEKFGGHLLLEGVGPRRLNFMLETRGETIVGTATLDGYQTFTVEGRKFPRGIELDLRNDEAQIRLSGGRRDDMLRGSYVFAGTQIRGSWQAKRQP